MEVLVKFFKKTLRREFIWTWTLMIFGALIGLVGLLTLDLELIGTGGLGMLASFQSMIIRLQDEYIKYIEEVVDAEDFIDFQAMTKEFNSEDK